MATLRSRHLRARGVQSGASTDNNIDGAEKNPATALSPTAPLPQPASNPASGTASPARIQADSDPVEKFCENLAGQANTVSPGPPPMIDLSRSGVVPATDAPLVVQAAGQITDGRTGALSADDSSAPESAQVAAPADPLLATGYQLPTQPPAIALTPSGDSSSSKAGAGKADTIEIVSSDDSASSINGVTPSAGPMQPPPAMQTETIPQSIPAVPASASGAMAEANRAVALRISRAIRSGEDTLTIELHPAELGHVAVRLAFHGNSVDVQMLVGRQETFQAFSQDRAALEQQFSQAGIDLGAGGLDLRYSQTPTQEQKQAWATGSHRSGDGPSETDTRTVLLGDNLVNIVA